MTGISRRGALKGGIAMGIALAMPSITRGQSANTVRVLHIETNKQVLEIWQKAATEFEKANSGSKIEFQGLETQAFKTRLPTMLQSDSRPHIFYSWGGGLVDTHAKAGFLEDISGQVDEKYRATLMRSATAQFTRGEKIYGLPYNTNEIGILFNRDLLAKAGVKDSDLTNWSGFIEGVRKLKAAGILPMAAGGQDKWPLMLLMGNLCLRQAGAAGVKAALEGKDGGFANPAFVRAGDLYREFSSMGPFQEGFLATKAQPAAGLFADGKAAMIMHGSWFVRLNSTVAADKKGLSPEQMGLLGFPMVPDGKGLVSERQVNLNGWLMSRGAPKLAVDFLKYFLSQPVASELAAAGVIVPPNVNTWTNLKHPMLRDAARNLASSSYLQVAYDQLLGPSASKTSLDIAVGMAAGQIVGKAAFEDLEKARQLDVKEG